MTEEEIDHVERELGFRLPTRYTRYLASNRDRLESCEQIKMTPLVAGGICLTATEIIDTMESANVATEYQMDEYVEEVAELQNQRIKLFIFKTLFSPDRFRPWHAKYFIIGEDGGDGYYLMRRNNAPGVYLFEPGVLLA